MRFSCGRTVCVRNGRQIAAPRRNSAVNQPADVAVAMSSEEQIDKEMLWPSKRRLSSALIRCSPPLCGGGGSQQLGAYPFGPGVTGVELGRSGTGVDAGW